MQNRQCFLCKNYAGELICLAFPLGIPRDILIGEFYHDIKHKDQKNDIVFKSIKQKTK